MLMPNLKINGRSSNGFEFSVEEDRSLKDKLFNSLGTKYARERSGIHASDLIFPRLSVFRKLTNSLQLTEKDVIFFALGRGEGEIIEQLLGERSEVVVVDDGIIHTIDSLQNEGDKPVPVEVKTTRAKTLEPRKHYLLQLGLYCLALKQRVGCLMVVGLNVPEIKSYRITFNLGAIRKLREERKKEILTAIKRKDPFLASCVWNDSDLNWRCRECEAKAKCESFEANSRMKVVNQGTPAM